MRCVALLLEGPEPAKAAAMLEKAAKTIPAGLPFAPLLPATPASVVEAGNALRGVLGQPRDSQAVLELYRVPRGPGVITPAPTPALFRGGDIPWTLARQAMAWVQALAELGPGTGAGQPSPSPVSPTGASAPPAAVAAGPRWAQACLPALHYLILGGMPTMGTLQAPYRALRAALERALGPEGLLGLKVRDLKAAGAPGAQIAPALAAAAPAAAATAVCAAPAPAAQQPARMEPAGLPPAAAQQEQQAPNPAAPAAPRALELQATRQAPVPLSSLQLSGRSPGPVPPFVAAVCSLPELRVEV